MTWRNGMAVCGICAYRWVAVQEVGEYETALECPSCGNMAGHWEEENECD